MVAPDTATFAEARNNGVDHAPETLRATAIEDGPLIFCDLGSNAHHKSRCMRGQLEMRLLAFLHDTDGPVDVVELGHHRGMLDIPVDVAEGLVDRVLDNVRDTAILDRGDTF